MLLTKKKKKNQKKNKNKIDHQNIIVPGIEP